MMRRKEAISEVNPSIRLQEQMPPEIDSKYRLVLIAAERSKQIMRGASPRVPLDSTKHKPTRIALEEIARGKVRFVIEDQKR